MLNKATFCTVPKVPIFDGKILTVLIVLIYGTIENLSIAHNARAYAKKNRQLQ